MKAGHVASVVLAAGFSRRAVNFKPLLPLGQESIVDHVISTFLQNRVDVYLVVGYRQIEVRAAIEDRDVTIIDNPDYELVCSLRFKPASATWALPASASLSCRLISRW